MNLLWASVYPAARIRRSLIKDPIAGRVALVVGAAGAAVGYAAVVYGMHTTMKRSFMMTVRRLAGTSAQA